MMVCIQDGLYTGWLVYRMVCINDGLYTGLCVKRIVCKTDGFVQFVWNMVYILDGLHIQTKYRFGDIIYYIFLHQYDIILGFDHIAFNQTVRHRHIYRAGRSRAKQAEAE